MRAVILAGGKGTRLKPYTTTIPKPLMPVGEQAVLEIIIKQLAQYDFINITLAVSHKANLIQAFCGNGEAWDVDIDYSFDENQLGTVGPITLIPDLPENFLVMNGDTLCDLNYKSLYEYHRLKDNDVTLAVYDRKTKIDFGVVCHDIHYRLREFVEKPVYDFTVCMGIYCIKRAVIDSLPKGKFYGFDDLMLEGIRKKLKIEVFRHQGHWLDIGRPEDYDYANLNYKEMGL